MALPRPRRTFRARRGWRSPVDCRYEAWRSPACLGTLVILVVQSLQWNRFVLTVLESSTYQRLENAQAPTPPAQHARRLSRGRRTAKPARGRRRAALDAQRGEPADSRPRGATWLRAVRAPWPPRGAQRRGAGAAAQRAGRVVAARRWRAGGRRCGGRRSTAVARDRASVVREPVAAAEDWPLARATSGASARNRRVDSRRRPRARGLSRRRAARHGAVGGAAVGAALRAAADHRGRVRVRRAPSARRAARGAGARTATRRQRAVERLVCRGRGAHERAHGGG